MVTGIKRSIKSAQVNLREINLKVEGSLATPKATGLDEFGVKQVIDGTNGLLTIIFNRPFLRDDIMVKGFCAITANSRIEVVAAAYDRITIQSTDLAGADLKADYFVSIIGSDFKNKS